MFQYSSNRSGAERAYNRGAAEEDEKRSAALKKRLSSLPYVFGVMATIASILYLSSLSSSPQLLINGKDNLFRPSNVYQQYSSELMANKLQNRSKFTIDRDGISTDLQNRFPEFTSVNISTPPFRHRPVIEVTLSTPSLILNSGNGSYLIDEKGRAVLDIARESKNLDTSNLARVNDQSTTEIRAGKPALTSGQVDFIHEIIGQAGAKQLEAETMNLLAGGGELDVKFQNSSYIVKFNLYENARKSVGTFLATKEQLDRDRIKPSEYIDVRVPERAYVK